MRQDLACSPTPVPRLACAPWLATREGGSGERVGERVAERHGFAISGVRPSSWPSSRPQRLALPLHAHAPGHKEAAQFLTCLDKLCSTFRRPRAACLDGAAISRNRPCGLAARLLIRPVDSAEEKYRVARCRKGAWLDGRLLTQHRAPVIDCDRKSI